MSKNESENSNRRIDLLNRQVQNILNGLVDLERDERGLVTKKRDMVVALAETFEQLHREGAYTQPVDTICAHICQLVREKGMLASERWIHEVLDTRYKQSQFSPKYEIPKPEWIAPVESTTVPEGGVEQRMANLPAANEWAYSIENSLETPTTSTESTDPYYLKKLAQKSIDEMSPEELRIAAEHELKESKQLKDFSRSKSRRAEMLKEKCDQYKIALDPEITGEEEIPVESALSEDSGPSLFSKKLREYSNIIDRAADKVEKYKPPKALDKKFANAIEEMIMVWRPWIDEKFRKDTFSWLHVNMDEAAHGKHAAATIHSTILPDGTKRALTREQVGDKKEMVSQQAMRILSVWKDLVAMHRWNFELQEKAIAARARRLHKRLSNSA